MVYRYISTKSIIAKLYRDFDPELGVSEGDVCEWVDEALDAIGYTEVYHRAVVKMEVKNYSVMIPCDLIGLESISYNGCNLMQTADPFGPRPAGTNEVIDNTTTGGGHSVSTDSFPQVGVGSSSPSTGFFVQDPRIYFGFEEGTIYMSYLKMPVDDEGYPMVPDMFSFKSAVTEYVMMKLDRMRWRAGKTTEAVYRDSERNWIHYCGQAKGHAAMPDVHEWNAIKYMWVRMLPRQNEFQNFFGSLNHQEQLNFGSQDNYYW